MKGSDDQPHVRAVDCTRHKQGEMANEQQTSDVGELRQPFHTLKVVVDGTPARSSDPMFIAIVAVIASVELSEDAEELERRAEPIV